MKPSGGGFKRTAMSFAAGAAGGVMAYSLMRSMSGSGYRAGHYEPGYGRGDTCVNKEDLNGTVFGTFRCPLNGFPYEAKYCCGEYERQFCCIREERRGLSQGASHVIGITVILVVLLIIGIFWARHQRQKQKGVIMIPTEIPPNEPQGPPYYHPAPPPMGYPPPPQGNPYESGPTQSYPHSYNPYQPPQPGAMSYPPQQPGAMPYPPQQPHYNPYQTGPNY